MSLLDDARRLYDEYMDEDNDKSEEAAMYYTELHPRIVATLEAAERLVRETERAVTYEGECIWCHWVPDHRPGCELGALMAALKEPV